MAKWIYEKWSLKWDIDAIPFGSSTTDTMYSVLRRIDVVTLDLIEVTEYEEMKSDELFLTFDRVSKWNGSESVTSLYKPKKTAVDRIDALTSLSLFSRLAPPPRIKKSLIASDITAEEGTVPDNGIHTDGYWYVKVKPAFPTMRILRDGQWTEVETGYVLKDGVWKQIEEIYKLQDGQWVQA